MICIAICYPHLANCVVKLSAFQSDSFLLIKYQIMKKSSLIAFLFIGGVVYFVTGGGILFGLSGGASHRSDVESKPAVRASSGAQANPFAAKAMTEE